MPFVLLIILAIIMWFVLHRSIYGRYLLAVGRNEEATRFSGINTRRVIASSYIVAGLLDGHFGHPLRVLHQLRLALEPRQLLRTLRHRGGGAGRLQLARR